VPQRGLPRLGLPVHTAPAAHDPLDLGRRARAPHRQQPRFGLRGRHPAQGADLGVGQLPAGQRLSEERERPEGARDTHPLARRPQVEPHPPGEPRRAGAEARVPAAPRVEGADQVEQAGRGGIEVRRQLGDLVAEPVERGDVIRGRNERWQADVHGESSFCWSDSTPWISAPLGPPRTGASDTGNHFRSARARPPTGGPVPAAGRPFVDRGRRMTSVRGKGCQGENRAGIPPSARVEGGKQGAFRGPPPAGEVILATMTRRKDTQCTSSCGQPPR
jgi:hypothetical protein